MRHSRALAFFPALTALLGVCTSAVAAVDAQSTAGQPTPPAVARSGPPKPSSSGGARWKTQFFYDEAKSQFSVVDLQFPSDRRGVALGVMNEENRSIIGGKNRVSGAALITSDGGEHWTWVKLKEFPTSAFFLNESIGWMVTGDGIWRTDESGITWKKLWGQRGVLRVWFKDEQRGWAVGFPKKVWETSDGGKHWTKLDAVNKVESREDSTSFQWIWFQGERGLIIGDSRPPRRIRADVPLWADPEDPRNNREWPALTILIQTIDGGKTWTADTGSVFGRMSRVRSMPRGAWVGLMEYREGMEYPSELYVLNSATKTANTILRRKDRQVTDFWITRGVIYAAGIEVPGKLAYTPVPGKVRVLRSTDLKAWEDIKVDYRALARNVVMAGSPDGNLWIGTDTGMILKLVNE